jgi:hypothetical protein
VGVTAVGWPALTIHAADESEVELLLRALTVAGHSALLKPDLEIEVGGCEHTAIMRSLRACLTSAEIGSVRVTLDGKQYLLHGERPPQTAV